MELFQETSKLHANFSHYEQKLFDRLKAEYISLLAGQTYEYYTEKKDLKRQGELNKKMNQINDFYSNPQKRKEMFPLETAREIMGEDFYGPEEITKAFDIDLNESNIPALPFTFQELESAKKEGFYLVLRVDEDANANPLTIQRVNEIVAPKLEQEQKGKVLKYPEDDQNEKFFMEETSRAGWCLQQKELLLNSTSKDYLAQTGLILAYFKKQKFSNTEKEQQRLEAIQEVEQLLPAIAKLTRFEQRQEATKRLVNLKINQQYRRLAVEVVYDHSLTLATKDCRLFGGQDLCDWTQSRSASYSFVYVGQGDTNGLNVVGWPLYADREGIGVTLSI